MAVPKEGILLSLISPEERDRIPLDVATKLETILGAKLTELIGSKKLLQTSVDNAEKIIGELKTKYDRIQSEHDEATDQHRSMTCAHSELQSQLGALVTELGAVRQQCSELEAEAAKLREERHLAVEDRDAKSAVIARKDDELSRAKEDNEILREQLNKEIDSKCEAQTQLGDLESRKVQLDDREKEIGRENTLFKTQITTLERQLTSRTDELAAIKNNSSSHSVLLENRLSSLKSTHNVLQNEHSNLKLQHSKLQDLYTLLQNEQTDAKVKTQQRLDSFQLELDAQHKLAELYRLDVETKNNQLEELSRELGQVKGNLEEVEKREVEGQEMVRKKNQVLAMLQEDLQKKVKDEELFPLAAKMAKMIEGNSQIMSLTEVYSQFVKVSEELIDERLESERQKGYIRKLSQELEEKGPWLQKALSSAQNVKLEKEELLAKLQHCKCDQFRCQVNDLGKQVCKLLQQRHQQDSFDITTKEFVTFETIEELQQTNQRLLSKLRELNTAALKEELKCLKETHLDIQANHEHLEKLTKTLTLQRDNYRTLYEQKTTKEVDQKSKKDLEQLSNEFDSYKKEKSVNERLLTQENERLSHETQQLTDRNSKLCVTLDRVQNQLTSSSRTADTLKRQVDVLEDRLKIHTDANVKLETALMQCKDELYESMKMLAKAEVTLGHKVKDLAILTDANERLAIERETFKKECFSLKLFNGNMELIKATMERNDAERDLKVEGNLLEHKKDLQKVYKDKADVTKELEELKKKDCTMKESLESERKSSEKLRLDLVQMRRELQLKCPGHQVKVVDRTVELEGLRKKLDVAKEALDQHAKSAELSSKQLTVLTEQYNSYRQATERQMKDQQFRIVQLEGGDTTKKNEPPNLRDINKIKEQYNQEVVLHSQDLLAFSNVKITLETVRNELKHLEITHGELQKKQADLVESKDFIEKEKLQLTKTLEDLTVQNGLLHDELEQNNKSLNVVDKVTDTSHLKEIIKYLRREKDVALSRNALLSSEQTRIKLDLEMVKEEMITLRGINEERKNATNDETAVVVKENTEVLDALMDSNRGLRQEREELTKTLKDLQGKVDRSEEMTKRCDSLQSENATLRGEATRWRQRANTLIEKTNRTSPEDWKKLQTERETLAKQLTIERANIVRLNDDLTTANNKNAEDLSAVKMELDLVKTDHITLGKDLAAKESELTELKFQLMQVRKIAKKYKVQYEENDRRVKNLEEDQAQKQTTIAQLEAQHVASLSEMERTKELMQGSKDRFTQVLKNVKDRMAVLTEAKSRLETELHQMKDNDEKTKSSKPDELTMEKERHRHEVGGLKERLGQLQRLLEESGGQEPTAAATPVVSSEPPPPPPTVSIRPIRPITRSSSSVVLRVIPSVSMMSDTVAVASTSGIRLGSGGAVSATTHDDDDGQRTNTAVASTSGAVHHPQQQHQQQDDDEDDNVQRKTDEETAVEDAVASSSGVVVVVNNSNNKRARSSGSSTDTTQQQDDEQQPQRKRTKVDDDEVQVESEMEAEVEYQVPTSSSHQEVDGMEEDCVQVISLVVSDEEEEEEEKEEGEGDKMEATSSTREQKQSDDGVSVAEEDEEEPTDDDGIVPTTQIVFLPPRRGGSGSGGVPILNFTHPHLPTIAGKSGALYTLIAHQEPPQQTDKVQVLEQERQEEATASSEAQEVLLQQQQQQEDDDDNGGGGGGGEEDDGGDDKAADQQGQDAADMERDEDGGQNVADGGENDEEKVEGSEEAIVAGEPPDRVAEDEGREAEATAVVAPPPQRSCGGSQQAAGTTGIPRAIPSTMMMASGAAQRRAAVMRPVTSSSSSSIIWSGQQHWNVRHPEMVRGRGLPMQRARRSRGGYPRY